MTVRQAYQAAIAERGYQPDPAQWRAVEVLGRCAREWGNYRQQRATALRKLILRPAIPRGVYLYGAVGRGKSFLLDCFFAGVPLRRKTRLHFHEFMREVHLELARLRGTADPLDVLAQRMARKHRLICFDEFHIADVTDAMILHQLLQALFRHGVGLVATSNFKPDDLYPDGLHRDRILPAIALLKRSLDVVEVDAGSDYRGSAVAQADSYLVPAGAAADASLEKTFARLCPQWEEATTLQIQRRSVRALRLGAGLVWFDFATLCGGAHSHLDYLEIAERFHTVFLSGVPCLPAHLASQARRFSWLVDVLYDRRVKLIVSAATTPENLYPKGPLAYEFARTVSRLHEMQSSAYLNLSRRTVATALTD